MPGDLDEPRLVLRRGYPGQRPGHRVAQLPPAQRLAQPRQPLQGPRHPHLLARRSRGDARPPAEPRRAAPEALLVPALAGVELADQPQEPPGRRLDVGREARDLIAHASHVTRPPIAFPCWGADDGVAEGADAGAAEGADPRACGRPEAKSITGHLSVWGSKSVTE